MKILVTGANGQLGTDVVKNLKLKGIEGIGTGRNEMDITDQEQTKAMILSREPDAVIHCAAYTAVDEAEQDEERCKLVNVTGTRNVALACRDLKCKLLYMSTDYVFPGDGQNFYEPGDPTGPLSVYGKTKLEGERIALELVEHCFIVRMSWVFGKNGSNFVKTMLRLGKTKNQVNVVADQIGSPTYTADLAPLLCEMALSEKYGIYHATNEGVCSWADFAREIFSLAGMTVKVNEISTAEYPSRAMRPSNSRLSKRCLDESNFDRLPEWKEALSRFLSNNE